MITELVTASTAKALEIEAVKNHLRIEIGFTDEDDYLKSLISVSEKWAENKTGRRFINQSWKSYISGWPAGDHITLPYSPLSSVPTTGVLYKSSTGNSTTIGSTQWTADTASEPPRVYLEYGYAWPTATLHDYNPISIEAVYGYGSRSSDVPEPIRQGMLLMISHWYENREIGVVGRTYSKIHKTVDSLLADYRTNWM